jgi:hypothetical protein
VSSSRLFLRISTVVFRWDEKAGLRRNALGSQVIDALKDARDKETGHEKQSVFHAPSVTIKYYDYYFGCLTSKERKINFQSNSLYRSRTVPAPLERPGRFCSTVQGSSIIELLVVHYSFTGICNLCLGLPLVCFGY